MFWTLLKQMRWENLASTRIWWWSFWVAMVPALPASLISGTFGAVVFLIGFPLAMITLAMPTGPVLYCPYCHKRVKMGATVCHHCSRPVRT